jgi:hypothetical protein
MGEELMLNKKLSSSGIGFTPEMAVESTVVWSMDQKYARNLVSGSNGTQLKHHLEHTFTSI